MFRLEGLKGSAAARVRNRWIVTLVAASMIAHSPGISVADPETIHTVEFITLDQGRHGEFRKPILMIATSRESWERGIDTLESSEALWVEPGRHAPDSVEWGREGVILVASGGGESDAVILQVRQQGSRLRIAARFPYLGKDSVRYSTYHLVKFESWGDVSDLVITGDAVLVAPEMHSDSPASRSCDCGRTPAGTLSIAGTK